MVSQIILRRLSVVADAVSHDLAVSEEEPLREPLPLTDEDVGMQWRRFTSPNLQSSLADHSGLHDACAVNPPLGSNLNLANRIISENRNQLSN